MMPFGNTLDSNRSIPTEATMVEPVTVSTETRSYVELPQKITHLLQYVDQPTRGSLHWAIFDLQAEIQLLKTEYQRLQAEPSLCEADEDMRVEKLERLRSDNVLLKAEINQRKEETFRLRSEVDPLKLKVDMLQAENQRLQATYVANESKHLVAITQFKDDNQRLRRELDNYREALNHRAH